MKEWLRKFQCSHEWIILHITRYETCDKQTKVEAELNFDKDNGLAIVKIEWEE